MEEIWKDIRCYEGLYQVSSIGRVRSLMCGTRHRVKILTPHLDGRGHYFLIVLHKNKILEHKIVHRLVAEAFVPNTGNLPCVNHKDENKQNNAYTNLEWCDYSYNATYGGARYRNIRARTKNNSRNREIPVLMMDKNKRILNRFRSCFDAARTTGFSRANIRRCCVQRRNGRNHTANGYIFEYDSNLKL